MMKERTWINRVAQREHQRDVANVKRSGGWLNMESKESVWCGSHMKRAVTRSDETKSLSRYTGHKPNNVWSCLKLYWRCAMEQRTG